MESTRPAVTQEEYESLRAMAKDLIIMTARQPPRVVAGWKPRTRSLQHEYEEGMRKIDPNWTPPKDDLLIIDYISIMP